MTKIREAFAKGKAFIPFVTCGDPDLETTKKIVKAMVEAGADIIELGIPFSDPTAEGPVIQAANLRALNGGVTTDKIFDMAAELRQEVSIPLVFMTYANVVYSYGGKTVKGVGVKTENVAAYEADAMLGGTELFIKKAAEVGINGIILPDVPFEEKEDFAPICKKYGIEFISLIAPTSQDRVKMIAADADGFVYCVSSLGVTGVRTQITTDIGAMVGLVREAADIPAAIGFGISTPEQAAEMSKKADGVIVGSAIVKIIAQYGKEAAGPVGAYVRSMKDAMK